jgi:hypothetical protein
MAIALETAMLARWREDHFQSIGRHGIKKVFWKISARWLFVVPVFFNHLDDGLIGLPGDLRRDRVIRLIDIASRAFGGGKF